MHFHALVETSDFHHWSYRELLVHRNSLCWNCYFSTCLISDLMLVAYIYLVWCFHHFSIYACYCSYRDILLFGSWSHSHHKMKTDMKTLVWYGAVGVVFMMFIPILLPLLIPMGVVFLMFLPFLTPLLIPIFGVFLYLYIKRPDLLLIGGAE